MFFSFDYVIKEMVNVAAVQPWSYGCTREVAKHERSVRVARGDSRVLFWLAFLTEGKAPSVSCAKSVRNFFLLPNDYT